MASGLKKILIDRCKKNKIKNLSKLSTEDLFNLLRKYYAVLKIQKAFRKYLGGNDLVCPITMETIKYPYFPYKPKGQVIYLYYTLENLVEYLLNTGDFRDPKTREQYSEETLAKIDKLKKIHKIKGKSVLRSSKNEKFYKHKKDKEDSIMVIERCIDDIVATMRNLLEDERRRRHAEQMLNTLLFMSFRVYFKRLVFYSREMAEQLIERTINIINETVDRHSIEGIPPEDINKLRDTIIQFLYQIHFDELERNT
jgi:hypothetical protein